ncbi:uncharacterized protein Tco025E_03669 [Trypanosoma conorhini]|uniref:Uncharacterized protein n=1 Tax=Trypanosoma conorhini TaxID=83891 RepID=A0A3R7MTY4_9TRYP|nr:uncharacterized protein Tco025E_03669 [Trypanosoma conorhini]RNF20652.1 hypothetical protein Tco025E_03669 [Trypanosoma conorhini]
MEADADLGSVAAAFRGTEEYAAAFDLEVWKAQQQARLRSELGEEKTRLRREVAAEVRKKEEERLGELDAFRRELEQVAQRLQLREETLQRRISQFEAREAVFEARRVKVAEQHEQHLLAVESRTRRQLEEAVVREGLLQAQAREREGTVARLEERLRAAENEHDTLQRYLARTVADDKEKARVARLEEESAAANAAVAALQLKLKEREAELAAARKERDQFEAAAKQCRDQLGQLSRRYSELQQQWQQRERALLDAEHRRLDEAKRRQQLLALEAGGGAGGDVHRCDLLGFQVAEGATRGSAGADPTAAFLKELQAEVAQGLRELRGKEKKKGSRAKAGGVAPAGPRLVYAEVSQPHHGGAHSSHVSGSARAAAGGDAVNTTLSSLTQRGSEGQPESGEPPHGPLQDRPEAEGGEEEDGVDVSSSYCYADVESWIAEREERRGVPREAVGDDLTRGPLPPLPPAAAAPPLPEDFLQASRAALPPASRESAREEMMAFVKKLRTNKQRLLESGVYTEDDTLLKEMTDKIALYEDFLLRHF